MTPHERAKQVVRTLGVASPAVRGAMASLIATALQAQSNEDEARHREKQQALRDLLAQQAQRADEWEKSAKDAWSQVALADERAIAFQAREAELRRALEPWWARVHKPLRTADGKLISVSTQDVMIQASEVERIDAALALSPGDALAEARKGSK